MKFQSLLNQGFDRDLKVVEGKVKDGIWLQFQFQSLLNQGFDRDVGTVFT